MKIYHKIPTCFNLLKPHIFLCFVHSLTICPSNKCEMSLSFWDLPLFWAIEHFREIYLFKFLLLYLKPLLSLLNGRKLTSIILLLLFNNCCMKKHNFWSLSMNPLHVLKWKNTYFELNLGLIAWAILQL